VHGYRVAAALGSPKIIVPAGAGVMSAIGFLAAPVAFDFARSFPSRLDTMDWARVNALIGEMEAEGEALLTRAGVETGAITHRRAAEMRYVGQGHEVRVNLPLKELGPDDLAALREAFEAEYVRLYGRMGPPVAVEAITWRVISAGPRPELHFAAAAQATGKVSEARKGTRQAYMPEDGGMTDVPVYDRYKLAPGARFTGPAIIEERESTTVIGPRAEITVDPEGNLVVEVQEPHAR
jgi:N-methylhydantoinase A